METNILCTVCHQSILPTYYFCPNCGAKLISAPLNTSIVSQVGIYLFSIILPSICFILITRWPGLKYSKSTDPKAKIIGKVAFGLLILSTIITYWLAYLWTQSLAKSINDALNMSLGVYGL